MATTNVNLNKCLINHSNGINYSVNSCKMEVNNIIQTIPREYHNRMEEQVNNKILISNNTYYGHHSIKAYQHNNVQMDCEMEMMSVTTQRSIGRKRSGDDVSFANTKRLKQEGSYDDVLWYTPEQNNVREAYFRECKKRVIKTNTHTHSIKELNENDLLLSEELLEGIHGCSMFHMLQEVLIF